jgi:hypothetical protein
MQALILCRGNISGIRSNPEGYGGAYLAPRPCNMLNLVQIPAHDSWGVTLVSVCYGHHCRGIEPTRQFRCIDLESISMASW